MTYRILKPSKLLIAFAALLALNAAFSTHAGGWAVITVTELPDYFVVAQPVSLKFAVRQHGMRLLSGLTPKVEIQSDAETVSATVTASGEYYMAKFAVPRAGAWTVKINSSFVTSNITLLPITALANQRATVALTAHERGQRLYVAKGCIGCHQHNDAGMKVLYPYAPDLSAKRYPAETLQHILTDPATALNLKPNRFPQMPSLELNAVEITALTAFINAERQAASR